MDIAYPNTTFSARLDDALGRVSRLAPRWDETGEFAVEGVQLLRDIGALAVPLPPALGGLGYGTVPIGGAGLLDVLRRIGRVSVSLGRVFEGHVNALRLVFRYGTRQQGEQAAADALDGHMFAIWAAEAPDTRVRIAAGTLSGRKSFASAAGHVTRALITAAENDQSECLILVPLAQPHGRDGTPYDLHGVRSAGTAPVVFDGIAVGAEARIGAAGDYMREPEISLGAWRGLAVQLGALEALAEDFRTSLNVRSRQHDPHQRARLGDALIAVETARLWVERSAFLAESEPGDAGAAAYVKLARVAVESTCLDAMRVVQRGAGLAAFVRPNPIERRMRDLATYLRQPALDMIVDEAAGYHLRRPVFT